MKKEEILLKIKEIETRSKLPAVEKNYTEKDYAIKELERIIFKLLDTNIENEIERLNSIIYEIETIVYADLSNIDVRISIQELLDKLKEGKK